MMKKTICLVTDWYPSKENPYAGLFFKEQAFALEDSFDFIVFRYSECIRRNPFSREEFSLLNKENNTVEYRAKVSVPIRLVIADWAHNLFIKYVKNTTVDGVGFYVSNAHKRFTQKKIVKCFEKIGRNADCFYCVDAQSEAYYLWCLAKRYNKPYVLGEHGVVPWPGRLITDANKMAMENADLFLAISNDKIRQVMQQNIKLKRIKYVGNLINEEKLPITQHTDKGYKTFVIVASNSFYKNYDMFIDVMNRLSEKTDKDFRVMIVGYGANKGYSKNTELLEEKVRQSQFADKAIMIREVPHDEIADVYSKADAFVMTSIQEGQPVSALEAACCGLPIFSTRCGGVEDYVDDEIGKLFDITDAEGMAEGLKIFLESEGLYSGEIIREKIIQRFGYTAFTDKMTEFFRESMISTKH